MILPSYRLIFWVGILMLPFSVLAASIPSAALLAGGFAAILLMLAITDAILAFGRLEGISVELPELVRLSKGRQGEMTIRILDKKQRIRKIRIGLPFPREIQSESRDMTVELPREGELSSVSWPCKAIKQGRYTLDSCYLEAASPLDFWAFRKKIMVRAEIRVYPDLFRERKNLASLFQNRGIGIHTQRQIGKGRDFEQLREYLPGDSYEDIHWKATAKRMYPVTKVFQIERTQEVYIIIDASRMSTRQADRSDGRVHVEHPEDQTTIMERYISAALIMGLATERQGDLFGLLTFSDNVEGFIKAKSGKSHFNTCRDALYTLDARKVTPDFSELLTFISMKIRRRALLIFLTNLDDPVLADSFIKNIDLVSKRHLVMVNMLNPGSARPLFTSPDVKSVNHIYRNLGGHIIWGRLHETERRLKGHGIGFTLLDNERMSVQLISQYLNIKQKQIL